MKFEEPRKAAAFALTFVDGKPILVIGTGNHECVRHELTAEQCDGFSLDWLNHRLVGKLGR